MERGTPCDSSGGLRFAASRPVQSDATFRLSVAHQWSASLHVREIKLNRYKRFTELTVNLPTRARLVMMCGPNGTGKTSLLEAMKLWHDVNCSQLGRGGGAEYHVKGDPDPGEADFVQRVSLRFHEEQPPPDQLVQSMYFRTAYRHEAEFAINQISRNVEVLTTARPARMIDPDVRVSDNYQKLIGQSMDAFF